MLKKSKQFGESSIFAAIVAAEQQGDCECAVHHPEGC